MKPIYPTFKNIFIFCVMKFNISYYKDLKTITTMEEIEPVWISDRTDKIYKRSGRGERERKYLVFIFCFIYFGVVNFAYISDMYVQWFLFYLDEQIWNPYRQILLTFHIIAA